MTDGLLGSAENFRDGYYQGFSGTDMEVIIVWGWQDSYTKEQKEAIWIGYKKVFQEILPKITKTYSQSA